MRKYNSKTKRTMIIIIVLFIVFIIIFSLFLKKAMDVAKTAYTITSGSILFDSEKNKIITTEEGTIKIKWGGNYYLVYKDKNYNLGSHSVVYNSSNGDITLYGKFYEVLNTGDVNVIKDENKIKSSVKSNFYKMADRKYLIIDRTIQATTTSLVTSNYLIINLDKLGNANLLNNNVSYKTLTPTKIKTSSYIFDIANEKINFGGEDIDLKKIIGSTNEYDEDTYDLNADEDPNKQEGTGNGTGTGTGDGTGSGSGSGSGNGSGNGTGSGEGGSGDGTGEGSGSGGGGGGSGDGTGEGSGSGGGGGGSGDGTTQGGSSDFNNNYDSGISDETVEAIVKATKNTSVIRVVSEISSISIDYVVYDPDNEYTSVYVEVENSNTGQVNVIYLSKTDTNVLIRDLTPKIYYNLTFKYRYEDKGQEKEYIFDQVGIYTKVPKVNISTTKMVNNKLYYKISLDNHYNIVGGTVNLIVNGLIVANSSVPTMGNTNEISGNDCYFDLTDVDFGKTTKNIVTIKLVSLSFNTYTVNPEASYKFKY